MKRRNLLTAAAGVTVAGAAMAAGSLISGTALASSAPADTMTAEAIIPDPSGEGYLSCTVELRSHTVTEADPGPHDPEADHSPESAPTDAGHYVTEDHPLSGGEIAAIDVEHPPVPTREGSAEECAGVAEEVEVGSVSQD